MAYDDQGLSAPTGSSAPSPNPLDNRSAAAKELSRKQQLREQGVQAGYNAAGAGLGEATQLEQAGQQNLAALDQSTAQGKLALRRNAAAGLAAGQAASGSSQLSGGGTYGAALQAGQTAGQNEAGFASQQALAKAGMQTQNIQQVGEARTQGYGQLAEAAKAAGEAGSGYSDRQKKLADYNAQIEKIRSSTQHWYGNDGTTAAHQLTALANNEEDPELKAMISYKARQAANDTLWD
jgi:hypothetical protein